MSRDRPPAALAALSDPIRVEIVDRVAAGSEVTVTRLAAVLPMTRQGVARHVATLVEAGVLIGETVGRETRYRVDLTTVENARGWMERRAASWDRALERLRAHLEDG